MGITSIPLGPRNMGFWWAIDQTKQQQFMLFRQTIYCGEVQRWGLQFRQLSKDQSMHQKSRSSLLPERLSYSHAAIRLGNYEKIKDMECFFLKYVLQRHKETITKLYTKVRFIW